jgi:NAD(P)-dependent dehydrogenase (short-subunit alcohol dehydrogenase family)
MRRTGGRMAAPKKSRDGDQLMMPRHETETPRATPAERVALVTGANKGLGREIARQLARRGMIVLASARNDERGRRSADELRAEGIDVRFLVLDVTDPQSVQLAAERIDAEFGRLDVLVNNAGITCERERPSRDRSSTSVQPSTITVADVRTTYDVNVFGVVAVTHAMLPLLRRASGARVVNMSSPLGSLTLRADRESIISKVGLLAYSSSKAALNVITMMYANELREHGILVNAANPGFVATDLNTHTGTRSAEQGAAIAVHLATLDRDGPTGAFLGDDGAVPW